MYWRDLVVDVDEALVDAEAEVEVGRMEGRKEAWEGLW